MSNLHTVFDRKKRKYNKYLSSTNFCI